MDHRCQHLLVRADAGWGRGPAAATEFPVAYCIRPKSQTPAILDRIGLWTIVGVVLIAIACIPVFLTHNYEFTSRGFYLWGP
jgi:hypothetical protein